YENCVSLNNCNEKGSDLIFPTSSSLDKGIANINNVQKDKKISVDLKNFNEGFYKWVVECYDNYSNSNIKYGIFQIDLNGSKSNIGEEYMYKGRIERLKEIADEFIISDFSLDEKIVLEEMKLLDDIKYYKKRLLTIQEFFKENYKYASDESKEKKISDYLDELEGIESSLPINISIKEKYEYVKNSINEDFRKIVEDYFYGSDIYISKSSLRKLEEANRKIQSDISVSTSVKLVKMEYLDNEEEIRFVEKKVVIEKGFSGKILEIIPENIVKDKKDIAFITKNKPVGDENIYELDYDDLEDGRIIYYITDSIKLKDLEKTETVLFEEDLSNVKVRVTGFFVFGDLSSGIALYIIIGFVLLIILFTLVPVVLRKFRMIAWKREPNVVRVIHLLEEIDKMLKEKEVEKAREKYYKLQEIYPVLPSKTKPHFYKKISEMLVKIDKKDIFGLVKEYQEAKKRWDKENVMRLYEDIKKIYKRLPDKDRKKVYDIINDY
ncbi:MAG: hypothetical protein KUL74_08700, partial [Cloacibacterium sp.]|nr:hypothetical protein [Cloacibacterium sp.]